MKTILKFLDQLWNLHWITGHRTQTAKACLYMVTAGLFYQTAATNADVIAAGLDLPDLTATQLGWLAAFSGYFSTKIAQFAKEHQSEPPVSL